MEKEAKQIIVIRKDLNMRKGKMIAQGAHASMKVLIELMHRYNDPYVQYRHPLHQYNTWKLDIGYQTPLEAWLNGLFTKIVLGCNSEKELLDLYVKAKQKFLPVALITDAGRTEFKLVPTNTAIAIGPAWSDDIDSITGHLSLL